MRNRRQRPYWLGAGNVTCSACAHGFVLEVGFHCSGCDRPLCGECAIVELATGEVLCLACREEEEGD
ncbi:MAG TPA: hypothetical protein VF832_07135 [Longimicrobiales bacterium]